MNSRRNNYHFFTVSIANGQERQIEAIKCFAKHWISCTMLDLIDETIQSFEAIGETAGELDGGGLIALEKERKTQLKGVLVLIVLDRICIWDFGASSSPLRNLAYLSAANLHAFVIKARTFCKPFDDKIGLSLDALHAKIKPIRHSIWIGLLLQIDLVCVWTSEHYVGDIATLKVAFEDGRANRYNFA